MGHKVHPTGFRLGIIRDWQSKWYADKQYAEYLQEDLKLRQAIRTKYNEAGISLVEIDRPANKVSITIHTARPGVVIGRGGQRVDEMRHHLEELIGKKVQLNILEIRQPELDAYLVARAIAEQIERRVAYRRVMKQAVFRTVQAGAKGVRLSCAGRLGGAEIARRQTIHEGQVPLHTLRADIDYGFTEAHTTLGRIGIKVWIYKGELLPEKKLEVAEAPAEPEAKPAEPVAPAAVETAEAPAEVKLEEKPAEPAAVAEEVAEAPAEVKPEEKPAKPRARKAAKAKAEVKPAEPAAVAEEVAEAPAEAKLEEKPAKPRARKTAKAKAKVKPATVVEEETDATTQTGEVPQGS